MQSKTCVCCNKKKTISCFGKNRRTKDGFHYYCKLCRSIHNSKEWPKQKKQHKNKRLQRTYGITLDDYNNMYNQQNGVCAICGIKGKAKGLQVDHSHKTGKVRGLLCVSCNTILGKVENNLNLIPNMLNYLK